MTTSDTVVLNWPSSEPGVLERAQRGDLTALEALYRTFERRIYGLALRILGRPEDAEEVLQETFLEVARSLPRYRGDGPLWGWIRKIAANKALMHVRRESLREADPLPLELVGRDAGRSDRLDLEGALAKLEPKARAVVWLHDVEGMTHREIAELTGRSESFSKSQLSRAHARLRRLLQPEPTRHTASPGGLDS
ncbi:MAG: sigma-70 family RNA polymerase sigma factor [Acidobacteriota bacterium]